MIWGPPSFRIERNNAALNDPLSAFDVSTVYRILIWFIAAILIAGFFIYSYQRQQRCLPNPVFHGSLGWYTWYGLFAVLSTIYSVRPLYTLFFAGKLFIAILLVFSFINIPLVKLELDVISHILNILYVAYIIQWLAIVVLYFIQPELVGNYTTGIGLRVTGGIFNDFGQSAAISGIFFLSKALFDSSLIRRNVFWLLYCASIVFVLLSQTRSVIVPTFLIFAIIVGLQRKWGVKLLFIWLSLWGVLTGLVVGGTSIEKFFTRGQNLESLMSLTGRSSAFTFLISYWAESPIIGYGFAAANRVFMQNYSQLSGRTLDTAHDLVSRVLVDLGVVGLLLLAATIIFAWREMIFCYKKGKQQLAFHQLNLQILSLLILSTFICITSPGVADIYWPFLFAIAATQGLRRLTLADQRLHKFVGIPRILDSYAN